MGCSRMLPKGFERPGAAFLQPGDLLHTLVTGEAASLLLASSRAGLPPLCLGPGFPRPLHPTHVLTDLPVAIRTAGLAPPITQMGWTHGTWRRRVDGLLADQPRVLPGVTSAVMGGSPMARKSQWGAPGLTERAGAQSSLTPELSSRVGPRLLGDHTAELRPPPPGCPQQPSTGHRATSCPVPASRPQGPCPPPPEHGLSCV